MSAPVGTDMRGNIIRLEELLLAETEHQIEIPVEHGFAAGIYARTIRIPAGTILTGKIHRTEHLNIISAGAIEVATEDGTRLIEAPCIFVAPPGTKRAGYTLSDTVWTTVHATHETDLDRLEAELIAPDYAALTREAKKCLG